MKINQKMLNIPPYISTSWKNVAALYVDNQQNKPVLSIALLNGTCVQIPNLTSCVLEAIFSMHSQYLEQEQSLSCDYGPKQKRPFLYCSTTRSLNPRAVQGQI